jgi:hypothetical protein
MTPESRGALLGTFLGSVVIFFVGYAILRAKNKKS